MNTNINKALAKLEDLREYIDDEVYSDVDYSTYVYLTDTLDEIMDVLEEIEQ